VRARETRERGIGRRRGGVVWIAGLQSMGYGYLRPSSGQRPPVARAAWVA